MSYEQETVISNIAQIRKNKGITKRRMSELLSIDESNYGRLEAGRADLPYRRLADIANIFGMSVVDIITYPDRCVMATEDQSLEPIEAVLQIKLKKDKRDQVLNLIFGDNNLELLMR